MSNRKNMLISSESSASISNVNRNIAENYHNKSQQEPENDVEISLIADQIAVNFSANQRAADNTHP